MPVGEICPYCGKRLCPGYVSRRDGNVYLPDMCLHCYKSNPDTRENYKRNSSTIGHRGGARS